MRLSLVARRLTTEPQRGRHPTTAPRERRRASAGAAARPGIPRRAAGPASRASAPAGRTRRGPRRWPTRGRRRVSRVWIGWPATLWWISTFGSRSARSDGRSIANGSQASVRLIGPSPSSSTQQQRRPSSSQVPSTISPPGASPACITDHASGTASTGYWRSTLNARTRTGLRPANSKPPSPNSTPSRDGRHPLRMDLQADDPDVGAHHPQPRRQLERRHRQRAVAEVDHQRIGGRQQRGAHPPRVHQPAVAAAQPVVAGGAPGDARRPA